MMHIKSKTLLGTSEIKFDHGPQWTNMFPKAPTRIQSTAALQAELDAKNAEIERLRGALVEVKETLTHPQPAIACTIWSKNIEGCTLHDVADIALGDSHV